MLFAPKYNLALVYKEGLMLPSDYQAIANEIRKGTSEIEIFIQPDKFSDRPLPDALGKRPLLTFCPTPLRYFSPPRGAVFSGQLIGKLKQLELLEQGGVRVPRWKALKPGSTFSENEWGPLVIVKPVAFGHSSHGRGIELVRTGEVKFRPPSLYPQDHPGAHGLMIVQQFIDTGDFSEDYRVVTLFGKPLYALRRKSLVKLERPQPGDGAVVEGVVSNATSGPRQVHYCYEEDVLAIASLCYGAIPSVPLQAIDVRRDCHTGRLYCLEINPGGNTWNFSSPRAQAIPTIDGIRREDQFGAWKIAAEVFIRQTRAHAA